MRGFADVHAHVRVNVDSLLAVFGHPSLAPSPLYRCHIWKTNLTAWAPFCKYNRPSTVGKHNWKPIKRILATLWLAWPQIPAGMCTKVIYCVILTPRTAALTHRASIYLETQTLEECVSHADAALHSRWGLDGLNRADNGMIYSDFQQVGE